jgi:GxxExxY protein
MILKDEVYQIVNCAFEVVNTLGHGINEKPYENTFFVVFGPREISFAQQKRFTVIDKGHQVVMCIPDSLAFDQIVIDTKVVDRSTDQECAQMINYLKITSFPVGLLFNFRPPKL